MSAFRDTKDREWELALTFGAVRRVRQLTGISLLAETSDGPVWLSLPFDPTKFADVLWALVSPVSAGITREDFEDSFGAETYPQAAAALYDAVTNFSPLPAARRKTFGTGEEMIRRMQEQTSNNGAGNLPAASASAPST